MYASDQAMISAAGPIAETMWACDRDPRTSFAGYLSSSCASRGAADMGWSGVILTDLDQVLALRARLGRDWPVILAAADLLVARRTVSGRELFELLSAALPGAAIGG
jgi:hypothetical protein